MMNGTKLLSISPAGKLLAKRVVRLGWKADEEFSPRRSFQSILIVAVALKVLSVDRLGCALAPNRDAK